MEPTEIDKGAGKRYGYIPDYSVWRSGFPLLVVESKRPDEPIEQALREAHLYANRINNRYPPGINPISHVLACNGEQFALAKSDSETEVLYAKADDLRPGTDILAAFKAELNREFFEKRAQEMNVAFQSRRFTASASHCPAPWSRSSSGISPFAQEVFPVVTRYFGQEADEAPDEIIDRGYVPTEERSEYGAVLLGQPYWKDRARVVADGSFQPIMSGGKHSRNSLSMRGRRTRRGPTRSLIACSSSSVQSARGRAYLSARFLQADHARGIAEQNDVGISQFQHRAEGRRRSWWDTAHEILLQSFCELNDIDLDDHRLHRKALLVTRDRRVSSAAPRRTFEIR